MTQPPAIWILDSSAIISVKRLFPKERWQAVFDELTLLLDRGLIAYPKKVVDELQRYALRDLPLEWANLNFTKIPLLIPPNPPESVLQDVMAQAGDVVDPGKQHEDGDPYVLALARYLRSLGHNAVVVTNDWDDKPTHISMRSACDKLHLPCVRMKDFLQQRGLWP